MKIKKCDSNRICVLYHYFEASKIYLENLNFFLKNAYLEEVDFHICISGECSAELITEKNITYHYVENKNNDYGAYCTVLPKIYNKDVYKAYFFINCSTRGPFFDSSAENKWYQPFVNLLNNEIHLSGGSINMLSNNSRFVQDLPKISGAYSHVQTSVYCLTSNAVAFLLDSGFYAIIKNLSKSEVITHYEIGLSRRILQNNWNMSCLLNKYQGLDFRHNPADINPTSRKGDPLYKNAYFGKTVAPEEVIFVKTHRRRKLIKVKQNYKFMLGLGSFIKTSIN